MNSDHMFTPPLNCSRVLDDSNSELPNVYVYVHIAVIPGFEAVTLEGMHYLSRASVGPSWRRNVPSLQMVLFHHSNEKSLHSAKAHPLKPARSVRNRDGMVPNAHALTSRSEPMKLARKDMGLCVLVIGRSNRPVTSTLVDLKDVTNQRTLDVQNSWERFLQF